MSLRDSLKNYNTMMSEFKKDAAQANQWSSAGSILLETGKALSSLNKATKPNRIKTQMAELGAEKVGIDDPDFTLFQKLGITDLDKTKEYKGKDGNTYSADSLSTIGYLNSGDSSAMVVKSDLMKATNSKNVNHIFSKEFDPMDFIKTSERSSLDDQKETYNNLNLNEGDESVNGDFKNYNPNNPNDKKELILKALSLSKSNQKELFKAILKDVSSNKKSLEEAFKVHWKGDFSSVEKIWDTFLKGEYGEWGNLTIEDKNKILKQ
tara:strand:+ start:8360 stop:9154 length:795 start_codon:yes stop_codon:yes gene_type:complete